MFHYLFERVNLFYEKVFFSYGKFISRHYLKVIVFSFMVNLILSFGILRLNMITNVDDLFFPIKSQARQDEYLVKNLFNKSKLVSDDFYLHQIADFGTWAEINFQPCSGGNILNEDYLTKIKTIHQLIMDMADYEQVCAKRNGQCIIDGLDLLEDKFYKDYLSSSMQRKSSLHQWDQSYDRKNFRFYVSFADSGRIGFTDLTFNLGKEFRINFRNESKEGKEPGFSPLVKLRYNLKDNVDNPHVQVLNWELKFLKLIKNLTIDNECNDKNGIFKISYAASQSLDIEMTANVSLDIKLVVGTFSLIIIFACLFMSMGSNLITSPSYVLPIAGVASAFFGITSSFGLCSYLNYPGCNLIFVIPFLVVGIGIDDMFLIYSSFQQVYNKKSAKTSKEKLIEELISKSLTKSGVSITITSLTDFTAFLVGLTTGFKSVQIFCLYAGIAILFCYFYQITFFVGFLCLHCRRMLNQRNAFLPCLKAKPTHLKLKFFNLKKFKQTWLNCFKFLICQKLGKLLTLFLFLVYISVSAWNAYQMHEGIELQNLVSDDSYYSSYVKDNARLTDLRPIVMLVMQEPIDYDDMQNRVLIENLFKNALKIKGISTFRLNWLDLFKSDKINYQNSAKNLIDTLKTYPPFLNDVVIKKTYFDYHLNKSVSDGYLKMSELDSLAAENMYEYQIETSRFYLQYSELYLSSMDAIPMHLLREVCQESGLPVFPYSITFKYYEQFEETLPNVVQSFIIALESMYLISLVFIPDLMSVFCIIASMLSIMTGLMGFMHLWGLTLSSITMIELIMSVGFCVDFSAHVTHAFITNSKGDRNKRAYKAFVHVGIPIFNSALSTIIGTSLLGFSKSYIFKSFFKTMIILMSLGMLNSLLFLPVLLSLIGPDWPMHKEVVETQAKQEEITCLNEPLANDSV